MHLPGSKLLVDVIPLPSLTSDHVHSILIPLPLQFSVFGQPSNEQSRRIPSAYMNL
ncbi:hypothetical protein ACO22_06030 [Paracoccidioides brasiliensis]|uniref:Uncharacterized protein n=1 Tax=Paracoccidioides brasiliensis TaxID=121759 RepID=A0A1D2J8M3_PARBR|nr:hypothetical protein ACO22_06030 [Paracoccidioides brasiliensis]